MFDLQHEKGSIDMLDYLIEENDLLKEFERYEVMPKDITFIKEQIFGPLGNNSELKV